MNAPKVAELAGSAAWRAGVLRQLGAAEITVSGRCMEPRLLEGQRVRVVAAAHDRCRVGDVVLVETAGGPRLHRLVLALPGLPLVTKADREATWDGFVPRSSLLGRAAAPRCRRTAAAGLVRLVTARLLRPLRGWLP